MLLCLLCGCNMWGERVLALTEKDSGKTFEIHTGSFVTLKLASNPSTGYQWHFNTPFDPVLLGLCRDSFLTETGGKKVAGLGGSRFLKFEVLAPGKAALDLKYVRPWEKDPDISRRFQVILYCVGKAKNDTGKEERSPTARRDQFGNDIPRKKFY